MHFIDQFKLNKFIEIMSDQPWPLFDTNLEKDEIIKNPSFFVYSQEGEIRPATAHNQYLKTFTLAFLTRKQEQLDILALAEQLRLVGLRFMGSEIDEGEFADTNQRAKMITLNFVHVIKVRE